MNTRFLQNDLGRTVDLFHATYLSECFGHVLTFPCVQRDPKIVRAVTTDIGTNRRRWAKGKLNGLSRGLKLNGAVKNLLPLCTRSYHTMANSLCCRGNPSNAATHHPIYYWENVIFQVRAEISKWACLTTYSPYQRLKISSINCRDICLNENLLYFPAC